MGAEIKLPDGRLIRLYPADGDYSLITGGIESRIKPLSEGFLSATHRLRDPIYPEDWTKYIPGSPREILEFDGREVRAINTPISR